MRTAGPGRDDQDPDVDDRRSVGFVVERVASELSRFVLFVRTGGSGRDQRDQEKNRRSVWLCLFGADSNTSRVCSCEDSRSRSTKKTKERWFVATIQNLEISDFEGSPT